MIIELKIQMSLERGMLVALSSSLDVRQVVWALLQLRDSQEAKFDFFSKM